MTARNEQGMVHAAAGYARMRNRLSTWACTASIGPGSSNMLTGAALATVNRLPVLLLPSDVFATRVSGPVLQELESPAGQDLTVNDAFRPLSRFFDRVWRPEQLPAALLGAMRVLTDPAETGAATIALPQDVQAQAYDWPEELFAERVWHVARPVPEPAALARAVEVIRSARQPLLVAGGGVIYSEATAALRAFAEATGVPVAETQAGKGSLPYDHPLSVGAVGSTGSTAANRLAADADVVIGVGTRWSDFTTASRTAFGADGVRFVNVNVAALDSAKHAGTGPRDVVICAAGSMPGDLHKLWRTRDPKGYHVEYGYSCMGYEIAGGLGVALAIRDTGETDRRAVVMVGDGSYLMMAQELVTAVQEGVDLLVVLVQNHGFASIGELSESLGSQRFGTRYRVRDAGSGRLDGDVLPVDLAANAESLGVRVLRANGIDDFRTKLAEARAHTGGPVLVHVETDPLVPAPSSESWWDVPVAEVARLESTTQARKSYEAAKSAQRPYLDPRG